MFIQMQSLSKKYCALKIMQKCSEISVALLIDIDRVYIIQSLCFRHVSPMIL